MLRRMMGCALGLALGVGGAEAQEEQREVPLLWSEIQPSVGVDPEEPKDREVTVVEVLEDDEALDPAAADPQGDPPTAESAPQHAQVDVNVRVAVHGAPSEDAPEAPRGKHFLAEASGGLTFTPGLGGAGHLLLGAGGRLAGGYLRFYAIGGLGYASVTGSHFDEGFQYEASRHHLDVLMGLRIYAPLFGPLRLFTDFLGGGSHVWSSVQGGTFGAYEAQGWRGVFVWGIGLQVRVTQELSVGGRLALRTAGDPLSELRDYLGLDDTGGLSVNLGGTVSWHF